jgi:hypothetical protein
MEKFTHLTEYNKLLSTLKERKEREREASVTKGVPLLTNQRLGTQQPE